MHDLKVLILLFLFGSKIPLYPIERSSKLFILWNSKSWFTTLGTATIFFWFKKYSIKSPEIDGYKTVDDILEGEILEDKEINVEYYPQYYLMELVDIKQNQK